MIEHDNLRALPRIVLRRVFTSPSRRLAIQSEQQRKLYSIPC
jgi:hypothetical protein